MLGSSLGGICSLTLAWEHPDEFYWRQRVWRALTFLFPPTLEAPPTAAPLDAPPAKQ